MAEPKIVALGTITIDPSKRDRAIEAMSAMSAASEAEEENIAYRFSADLADPATFYLVEQWASEEAAAVHMGLPHMAEFIGAMPECGLAFTSLVVYGVGSVTKMM